MKIKENMQICVKIENSIRKPCSNFLSYLYNSDGWRRVMFDMAKENNCISSVSDVTKNIKIQVINDGTIRITGYSIIDILTAMEYIADRFDYARMPYLFFDEYVKITTNYTYSFTVKSPQYYVESHLIEGDDGNILIEGNTVTITTESLVSINTLTEVAMRAFSCNSSSSVSSTSSCESTSPGSSFDTYTGSTYSNSEEVEYDSDTTIETSNEEEKEEEIELETADKFNMEGLCISAMLTWCAVKVIEAM